MTRALSSVDEKHIEDFLSTGKFKEGTLFYRDKKPSYWCYECPICSRDDYVLQGLCSGVFRGFSGNLKKGKLSCRCSVKYNWTKEQQEYRCRLLIESKRGLWIGWESSSYDSHSKVVFSCEEHGVQTSTPNKLTQGRYCPKCASQDSQTYFYVVSVEQKGDLIGYKFGITKDFNGRKRAFNPKFTHSLVALKQFANIKDCQDFEKSVKSMFSPSIILKYEYYGEGYTETLGQNDGQKLLDILEAL